MVRNGVFFGESVPIHIHFFNVQVMLVVCKDGVDSAENC